jgi:hypothetical protein
MAATTKEIIPIARDNRNKDRVTGDFPDLSQKKTIIAGRVAVNNKSKSTKIPFIIIYIW